MKLDLSEIVKDYDGKEFTKKKSYGLFLAEYLFGITEYIEKVKAYQWGVLFYKEGVIDIDRSDLSILRKEVQAQKKIGNYISGLILIKIDDLLIKNVKE